MKRILFMSNDPIFRKKNAETLSENGFDVVEVSGALDGLLRADKNGHAAIIIDEELSDIDGYRACPKIRQYSKLPIILLGSESADDVWSKSDDIGFDIYLKKPISPRELTAHIKVLLKRMGTDTEEDRKPVTAMEGTEVSQTVSNPPVPPPAHQYESAASPADESSHSQNPASATPASSPPRATPPKSVSVHEIIVTSTKNDENNIKQQQGTPVANNRKTGSEFSEDSDRSTDYNVRSTYPDTEIHQQSKIEREKVIRPFLDPTTESPLWLDNETKKERNPSASSIDSLPVYQDRHGQPTSIRTTIEQPRVELKSTENTISSESAADSDFISSKKDHATYEENRVTGAEEIKGTFKVWQDAYVAKLLDALLSNKITEIVPSIDPTTKNGFSYPNEDALMQTSPEKTAIILERLAEENILLKKPLEKLRIDPDNSFQLLPVERCPRCDSSNLLKGQLIEHFFCGYVGLEQDYVNGYKYICPKCKRELKLLGTDYRNAGLQYKCLDCSNIFPTPVIKWRSFKTGKVWTESELRDFWIQAYTLNPDKRDWLEFQLKPKGQLVEFLRNQGYHVQELAQIHGNSGAIHTVDILATRDDGIAKYHVGVGILTALPGEQEVRLEELFKFDTRAYDMGINYKVVIAIPKLGQEALKFAERQNIGIFEANDLSTLMNFINNKAHPSPSGQPDAKVKTLADIEGTDTSSHLAGYLRQRGYEVFEKARISGKSGAEHIFDIYARRDDVIVRPTIAIDLISAEGDQMVGIDKIAQFDAEAYDVGIRNKVVIGHPQMSGQAKQFSKQQRIKALDAYELKSLLSSLI